MNLILRLLRVFIAAFFRSKLTFKDESVVSFRVWFHDLDINSHMTNSRYLAVMDLGRTDLLIRTGLGRIVMKNRWSPVLASTSIRWRKSLLLFQKYTVHTRLASWDEKWFYLDQKVVRNNRVVAHALQKAIFVGKEGAVHTQKVIDLYEDHAGPIDQSELDRDMARKTAEDLEQQGQKNESVSKSLNDDNRNENAPSPDSFSLWQISEESMRQDIQAYEETLKK